jgi:hypothetical protein
MRKEWHEWVGIVNSLLLRQWGLTSEMLNPEPPLVDWWQEGVSPHSAARWAVSCDNG